jgi:hypothetical protein
MNIDTRETDRLIASDKVEGTAVYNNQDERLGTVERFMVDKATGQVEYAVMSFGGLFGMGSRLYPLPWRTLTYDTDKGGYVVALTRAQIEDAPSYGSEEDRPIYDRDYGTQVYSYYGLNYI